MKSALTRLAGVLLLATFVLAIGLVSPIRVQAGDTHRPALAAPVRTTRDARLAAGVGALRPQPVPVRTPTTEDRTPRARVATPTPRPSASARPVPVPVPAPPR